MRGIPLKSGNKEGFDHINQPHNEADRDDNPAQGGGLYFAGQASAQGAAKQSSRHHHNCNAPDHPAGEHEKQCRGDVDRKSNALFEGVQARQGIIQEQAQDCQQDHAVPGTEIPTVNSAQENRQEKPRFRDGSGGSVFLAAGQPISQGCLNCQQGRCQQDHERHQICEKFFGGSQ